MSSVQGQQSLFNAIESGNMEEVRRLVHAGCDFHAGNEQGYTPLHMAVGLRKGDIVEYLIACGASVHAAENHGMTPVQTAIIGNSPAIVRTLVRQGADLSRSMAGGGTALHDAVTIWTGRQCAEDKVEIVKILVEGGVSVHGVNRNGNNALDEAYIILSQVVMQSDSLTFSPDGDSGFRQRDPELDRQMVIAMKEVIPLLEQQGVKPGAMSEGARAILAGVITPRGPLFTAVMDNDYRLVRELLRKGAQVNEKDGGGGTPLHFASCQGHLEISKYLILMGADVNSADNCGSTPLHLACDAGLKDLAELFISKGADINAAADDGLTALHLASRCGAVDLAAFLISKGADINAKDTKGFTPLTHPATQQHVKVVKILREAGRSGGKASGGAGSRATGFQQQAAPGSGGESDADDEVAVRKSLYKALETGDLDQLKALVDRGADVSGRTSVFDKSPLHWAAFFKQEEIAEYLLGQGALVDALDAEERTPLHMAAFEGTLQILEMILRAGAPVNNKDLTGKSAIHLAAERGTGRMVKILLESGANAGEPADRGATPLHWAAFKGNTDTAAVLLANGADANAADDDGYTPLNWSQTEGRREMSQFLRSRGAKQAGIFGILKRTYDNKVKEVKKFLDDRQKNNGNEYL